MTLPIKSILSCMVILATASDIHTKKIVELGSATKLELLQVMTAVFGEGTEPGQLPIVAYSLKKDFLHMSVYTEWNKCDFPHLSLTAESIELKAVKQLTSDVVVTLWNTADTTTVITRVLVIYMNGCVFKMAYEQMQPISSPDTVAIVSFANGYDLITSKNVRVRLDISSDRPSNPDSFPVNSIDFSISAISKRTYNNGFFVVDNTHQKLKLVKEDKNGFTTKNLLALGKTIFLTNNEQSLYSVCTYNPLVRTVIACYQFDELGNLKWKNSVGAQFVAVLGVKNLAGGGVVFATFLTKGKRLTFVRLGYEVKDVNIWSYSGKQEFEGARLKEYSEKDHTFVLAYRSASTEDPQYSIEFQKFSLQN